MRERQQNSTTHAVTFLMVSSTDHTTGVTGLTPTVTISKDGGAFGSPSGAVSEIGNGWYALAGNATDRNTLGAFLIHATGTGADPMDVQYTIVGYDPFDATRLGLSALPNAAPNANGGLPILSVNGTTLGYVVTVGTNNDKTGYSLTQSFPANFSALGISVAGKINEVVLVDNCTVNTDMRGTDNAALAATALSTATWTSALATNIGTLAGHDPGATLASTTNITAGTFTTVTNLTNLPGIPANWLTAAGIAAGALNGKGDWNTIAPNNSGIASIVAKLPVNNIADETLVIAATSSILVAVGTPQQVGTSVTVGGYAAGQDPATLVLDAPASLHNLTATIGAHINTDLLAIPVPGAYPLGSVGGNLGRIGTASITVNRIVTSDGSFSIYRGDSYYAADGRSILWTSTSWPVLTGATAVLSLTGSSVTRTVELLSTGGASQQVQLELSTSDSLLFPVGSRSFRIVATLTNGHEITLVEAICTALDS